MGTTGSRKDASGPSDERAADPGAREEGGGTRTGGVDVKVRTKDELMDRARKLNIRGRSSMTKQELAEAINRANEKETAEARERQC